MPDRYQYPLEPCILKGQKICVALIGCGRISSQHLEAIKKHQDELVLDAVCDINLENLKRTMNTYGCKGYSSVEKLLANTAADIVCICTPGGLHLKQVCDVATTGRHVIVEKPMATSLQDGLKMIEVCNKSRIILFVVLQNRMNPTIRFLKDAIDKNRFGQIYLITVNVFWFRTQAYYSQASWRGTRKYDGGALMNQASHYIDLLCWLFGPIKSVQAMTATLARNIEMEDTGVLNLRWYSGALGSISVTMLTYPDDWEGSITIIGEKGKVRIAGMALNEIQHWEFQDSLLEDLEFKKFNYKTGSVYGLGYFSYYDNVIKALRDEDKPAIDGYEGIKSLEVLTAAYASAQDGNKKNLPLKKSAEAIFRP